MTDPDLPADLAELERRLADRVWAEPSAGLFVEHALAFDGLRQEGVHHSTDGAATVRMTSATHVGA